MAFFIEGRGLALLDYMLTQTNSSSATEGATSWPCPWKQSVPGRPCSWEYTATSLQTEMVTWGTYQPHLKIWQSKSPLDRPYLGWCLSAFCDTALWVGLSSDISQIMVISKYWQERRSSQCSRRQRIDSTITMQSSRWQSRWIPFSTSPFQ